jgi:hypothetical protein
MKVYAYVKSETCVSRGAVLPGSLVGRNQEPVSRHGDYRPWWYGKRETLAIINQPATAANSYHRQCARLVANLRDWSYENEA